MSINRAISYLEEIIHAKGGPDSSLTGRLVELGKGRVLSLELLFNSAVHQVRNELTTLGNMCPQGYNYTFDPPAIFAAEIGAEILTRLHCAALKWYASKFELSKMRVFAFNDYSDPSALALFRAALEPRSHVRVLRKSDLFGGVEGLYSPPDGTLGALLVVHNNSDAFGQNIATESDRTSMDGTIGSHSSAAASLARSRADLLDMVAVY